tara:strand:- start:4194 stop:5990 length:1797 start_codon:yes stop_codon:yes gene_type:complete
MSIAELLDYGLKEVPQQAEIRTETIEPNNATTDLSKVFKYTIRNVGFLEGTSMLTFKLKRLQGANEKYRVNLWSGALSCIKNAHLRIGDYEVQNAQDVDRISAMLNLNKSVLQRRNVLGHYLGNSLELQADDNDTETTIRASVANVGGRGQIVYDRVNSGVDFAQLNGAAGAKVNSLSIVDTTSLNEKYGIPLSMIFPCLKGRSLPLFLFTDYNIQLEFEMNFADKYAYNLAKTPVLVPSNVGVADAGAPYVAGTQDIGFNEVQLVVDYMLPPSSVINNYLEQTSKQGGYRFEFPEISVVKKKLAAVGSSKEPQEVEHRLGQTGKEVHNIVMAKRFVDNLKQDGAVFKRTIDAGASAISGLQVNGINCENISIGAKISSVGSASGATAITSNQFVEAVNVEGRSLTMSAVADNNQTAATTLTFKNPNSMGLARKILGHQAIHGIDEEEYNVEVNGLDLYPQNIYNNASFYNQMSMVMGEDLILPRPMYFNDPNAERQRLAPVQDGLVAQYKPLGADLSNGMPGVVGGGTTIMSGSPLIWKYKRKPRMNGHGDGSVAGENQTEVAIDYRGEVDVDYYITHSRVVVVKKLPKGTSVMVSS